MNDLEAWWWAYWIVPPTTAKERRAWRTLTYVLDRDLYRARFFHARRNQR